EMEGLVAGLGQVFRCSGIQVFKCSDVHVLRFAFRREVRGGGLGGVEAEEVVLGGGGLGVGAMVQKAAFGGADGLEEDLAEVGEGGEALRVEGSGVVEGVDEQLAEQFGDVDVVEDAGEA